MTKTLYPERLLVYHAGTGKTVFLGCLKVTTVFLFIFSTLFLAPAYFQMGGWPLTSAILVGGAVPMVFVGYITSPFVTYIHMRLPIYARRSKDILIRFVRTLSPEAELDVTTMTYFGMPGITRLKAGELRPAKKRFGVVNFVRVPPPSHKPAWWRKDVRDFFVGPGQIGGRIREMDVWDEILNAIKRGLSPKHR